MVANSNKSIKRKVVDQLVEGYSFANQLKQHLLSSHNHHNQTGSGLVSCEQPDPVHDLLAKILGSFDKSLTVLDDSSDSVSDVSVPIMEGSRNASCGDDSSAPASCNGGDSGDSRKRGLGVVTKGKRGCYTRKMKSHTEIVISRTTEDSHAWRKYGQKVILNSTFPRNYYRCTHKQAKGCKATKQVQKQEQDPEMYQITYIGYHTCNTNDQTQAKTEPFDQEINIDSDKTLAPQGDVIQEQENNMSSVTMLGANEVKEETINNGEISSKGDQDLSLVWQESMMFDDQNQYYGGETSTTSHQFTFIDNNNLSSFFDSYYPYQGL